MLKSMVKLGLGVAAIYGLRKIYKAYKEEEKRHNNDVKFKDIKKDIEDEIRSKIGKDIFSNTLNKDFIFDKIAKGVLDSKDFVFNTFGNAASSSNYVDYIKTFKRLFSALGDVKNFPYSYNVSYLKKLNINVSDIENASGLFKKDLGEIYGFINQYCDNFETLIAQKNDFNHFSTKERILFENLYLAYGAVIGMMEHLESNIDYTQSTSNQLHNMLNELRDRI